MYASGGKERTMAKTEVKAKSNSNPEAKAAATMSPAADLGETGSVDKIRDILFGNQMRDFERRFSQMEDRVTKATHDLREEIHKRLETLEAFFKKEIKAVLDRLKNEANELAEADKHIEENLKSTTSSLKKSISQVEEDFSQRATELRQDLLQQSKSLTAEIQTRGEEASETLRNTANDLDDAKINRSTLAEYLIEMAMRLSDHGDEAAASK
jgi:ABC-type transporter Mla subunit MlaD